MTNIFMTRQNKRGPITCTSLCINRQNHNKGPATKTQWRRLNRKWKPASINRASTHWINTQAWPPDWLRPTCQLVRACWCLSNILGRRFARNVVWTYRGGWEWRCSENKEICKIGRNRFRHQPMCSEPSTNWQHMLAPNNNFGTERWAQRPPHLHQSLSFITRPHRRRPSSLVGDIAIVISY